MDITAQHHYNTDVDTVIEGFFNSDHISQKFTDLGNRNVDVTFCDKGPNKGKIAVSYETQASDNVPPALRSFSSEWTALTQTELWKQTDGEWHCEYTVELDGVPAELSGTMHLRKTDNGCVNEVSLNIKCGIPILGNMIEEFISKDSEQQMEDEYQYIKAYLKA